MLANLNELLLRFNLLLRRPASPSKVAQLLLKLFGSNAQGFLPSCLSAVQPKPGDRVELSHPTQ